MTLNEPNLMLLLRSIGLPPPVWEGNAAALTAAARKLQVEKFAVANVVSLGDIGPLVTGMLAGHKAGRDAIKAVRPDLAVGLTLAVVDEQAVGRDSLRDAKREEIYGECLAAAEGDEFIGVQNYSRRQWDDQGALPPPDGAVLNSMHSEVYAPSLAELRKAMDEGVPVSGYMHWTLFDNFEWTDGYAPKFGLIAVDRQTFVRKAKPSARVLGDIARRNALD